MNTSKCQCTVFNHRSLHIGVVSPGLGGALLPLPAAFCPLRGSFAGEPKVYGFIFISVLNMESCY